MKKQKFTSKRLNILKKFQRINFECDTYINKLTKKVVTVTQIAKDIKLDRRQTIRVINFYKECLSNGRLEEFLIHKNSNKEPWNKFDDSITRPYVNKYLELEKYYSEINSSCLLYPSQFISEISENNELKISESSVRKYLKNEGILSPLAKKKTKRIYKKNPQLITDKFRIEQNKKALMYDLKRATSKWLTPFGRRVEGDACFFDPCNLGYNVATGAIVDHSGFMLTADCDLQETNALYDSLFTQLFAKYGLPETFVIDCRSTFYSPPGREKTDFTQALESKDIEVICSSAPTAKPNVERAWNSLQNWIKFDLTRLGIKTYSEYKHYCRYLLADRYNIRFKKTKFKNNNKNVFRKINPNDINGIFDKTFERTVTRYGTVKINNEYYKAIDSDGNKVHLHSDSVVIHKQISTEQMYIHSGTSKYMLIKDNLKTINIEEQQTKIISELKNKIFLKDKKISYLETKLKNLESFVESKIK